MNALALSYFPITDKLLEAEARKRYVFSLPFCKNKKVLEVGCGARGYSLLLAKIAKRVSSIDVDEKAIAFCKKNFQKENLDFFSMSATRLDFLKNSFDTIVCLEVIEHLSQKEQEIAVSEIFRCLKKHGTLILSTPNKRIVSPTGKSLHPDHKKELGKEELLVLLSRFGSIKIFGQQRNKSIDGMQSQAVSFLRKIDFFGLRLIVPLQLRFLFGRIIARISGAKSKNKVTLKDFSISKKIDGCIYFLAVCKK